MKEDLLKSKLNSLIGFYEPYRPLAESHMASVLTDNLWEKNVPAQFKHELFNIDLCNEFIKYFPSLCNNRNVDLNHKWQQTANFIKTANEISIRKDNTCLLDSLELENHLNSLNCFKDDVKFDEYMSKKKFHEVKIISKVISMLMKVKNSSHVVDVGGGKGYLSTMLVLQYNCKVLGLDSSIATTCGASELSENVAKKWKANSDNETALGNRYSKGDNIRKIEEDYKQIIEYVTPNTNILNLAKENFMEEIGVISLVGLHTCGDLAPTCLHMFINNEKVDSIVNVGCCYHKLNDDLSNSFEGFPMSNYLKNKKFSLEKNSFMLAQQSIDKFIASSCSSKTEIGQRSLLFRAILEVILKEHDCLGAGFVARLGKKCDTFQEYVKRALEKLDLDIKMSDDEIADYYQSYQGEYPFFKTYCLLRMTLAPVIESIILLDRLLYLLENGIENAFLVKLFDLSISPRGFGLVAWKK